MHITPRVYTFNISIKINIDSYRYMAYFAPTISITRGDHA